MKHTDRRQIERLIKIQTYKKKDRQIEIQTYKLTIRLIPRNSDNQKQTD